MDLGPAFAKSVRAHAPQAVICFDPFHVVKLATDALDDVRRQVWQSARKLSNKQIAKTYKGARWALLVAPLFYCGSYAPTAGLAEPQPILVYGCFT